MPGPPDTGDDDFYFDLQWGITAVDAQNAWAQGRRGKRAIVAVLDEGVDATHPDLAPNVRADLSTSFAEDCVGNLEDWQPEPGFYFNHGTHVAGIVASADNAFGTIGVAPEAQIMAVGVLSRCLGYGLDSWIIDGIRYAADHGADVINMSLGSGPINTQGACDSTGCYTAEDVKNLRLAYAYAAIYANLKGATVIASSGNDGFDFGASPEFIHLPSDTPGILSISATAPIGWGVDSTTDLDVPTYYSNFGKNRIDFAAPGGTDEFYVHGPERGMRRRRRGAVLLRPRLRLQPDSGRLGVGGGHQHGGTARGRRGGAADRRGRRPAAPARGQGPADGLGRPPERESPPGSVLRLRTRGLDAVRPAALRRDGHAAPSRRVPVRRKVHAAALAFVEIAESASSSSSVVCQRLARSLARPRASRGRGGPRGGGCSEKIGYSLFR